MIISSNPTKTLVIISALLIAEGVLLLEPSAIAQNAISQTARIEKVTGQVRLKRKNWLDYRLVRAGAPLEQGDLLFPATGARVKVVCPDLSKRSVKAGVSSGLKLICPIWPVLKAKGGPSPGVLGGNNPSIPYIVSPRHTLLLSNPPFLSWNPVSQVTQYKVQLFEPSGMQQEQLSKKAQFKPSGNLKAAIPYFFTVQTNTGKSSQEEGTANINFRILRSSEAVIVQEKVAQVINQKLDKQATALLLSELYSNYLLPESAIADYGLTSQNFKSYNLTAEAISTVETLISQGERSPILYRTLGDLYWQSGLTLYAIDAYQNAIKQANMPEDLEEQALSQYSIGEIYAATSDESNKVAKWYQQALNGYKTLGDSQRVEFLQLKIERLKQQ
jgi:tetratricopeptide (TPR) repeat protein